MDHLDLFTSQRIKGRFYQYTAIVLLGLVNAANGGFMLMTSIVLTCIQNDYDLSTSQLSILTSLYQVGIIFGSMIGGDLAKTKGRSISIKIFLTQQLLFGSLIYFCDSYYFILMLYCGYGIYNGFCINVLSSYSAEISPFETRGRWMIVVNAFLSMGKVIGTLFAYWFLNSNISGDWKNQFVYLTVFTAIVYPLVIIYLKESLRFLYANKLYNTFHQVANEIVTINNIFAMADSKTERITKDEVEYLEHQTDIYNETEQPGTYRQLFSKQFAWINILIWTIWGCMFMVMVGQTFILPFWFDTHSSGLLSMVVTLSGEIPAILLGYFMIDKAKWGRRKLLQIFTLFLSIIFITSLFFENNKVITGLFLLARFSVKGAFIVLVPFTAEVYPTKLRSMGLGIGAALGGFSTCIMSFIIFPLYYWWKYSVFVFFGGLSLITFLCCMVLPYDTTGQSLDNDYSKSKEAANTVEEDLLAKGLAD